MNIELERKDNLNGELQVEVFPEDYQEELKNELKKYRKKINLPGFRQGKAPLGLVQKRLGENFRKEKIQEKINKEVEKYLKDNNIDLFLNPLLSDPSEDSIDWQNQEKFNLKYDVGIKPELNIDLEKNLQGLTRQKVKVEQKDINDEVDRIRKEMGKVDPLKKVEEGEKTNVNLNLTELAENGEPLEGGVSGNKMGTLSEMPVKLKEKLLGRKEKESFQVNLRKMFSRDEEIAGFLGKDKLTVKDLNDNFLVELLFVFEFDKADLNQELYNSVFQGEEKIENLEEFKNKVSERLNYLYERESNRILDHGIKDTLMDNVELDMPDEFLKKWFDSVQEDEKEDEKKDPEEEFKKFRKDMQWLLIIDYLVSEFNVEVTQEQVLEYAKSMMYNEAMRIGMQDVDENRISQFALNYLQDPNNFQKLHYTLKEQEVYERIREKIDFKEKEISKEEFDKQLSKETKQ